MQPNMLHVGASSGRKLLYFVGIVRIRNRECGMFYGFFFCKKMQHF